MEASIVSIISVTATLRALPLNKAFIFQTAIFKAVTIRATAHRLRPQGYEFKITERGLINEVQVTRIK